MARNTPNRKAKAPPTNNPKPAPSPPHISSPLEEFTPAPVNIVENLLNNLPKDHVYLTSIDTTSPSLKQRAFLVPIILNTVIVLGLCYRIYIAFPTYLSLLITIFGQKSSSRINTQNATLFDLASVTGERTFFFMFDYALFSILGSWPYEFLFGSNASRNVGPLEWRLKVRFLPNEILVRRSRRWDKTIFATQSRNWSIDDGLTLTHKITPAMSKSFLAKTGYAMLDKDWDLDFAGMVQAQSAVSSASLSLADFTNKAFIFSTHSKQWLVWDVHAQKEYKPQSSKQQVTLDKFKEKLAAMGHEDLFYRWIELVQYESSTPGGFTEGRQAAVMREARTMFQEKGVDFAKFWQEVGGREGMPGLDDT